MKRILLAVGAILALLLPIGVGATVGAKAAHATTCYGTTLQDHSASNRYVYTAAFGIMELSSNQADDWNLCSLGFGIYTLSDADASNTQIGVAYPTVSGGGNCVDYSDAVGCFIEPLGGAYGEFILSSDGNGHCYMDWENISGNFGSPAGTAVEDMKNYYYESSGPNVQTAWSQQSTLKQGDSYIMADIFGCAG